MASTEYDLVVRGGTVVDGSGGPGRRGDVAVTGDRIVAVGDVEGRAAREIDAGGLVVAPGFIDAHTHMDAQLFWDDLGRPACWHGVTTVVMGNCGFTLAPARRGQEALVVRNLERAEDISPEAMAVGIDWTWQSFAEFLDAVDARPKGLNHVASIGHSALRTWAMGERAFDGPASDDDLAVMESELRSALAAGAAGFTTSRGRGHATSDGRPVASRLADWSEVEALVTVVGEVGRGAFQLAPERYLDPDRQADFVDRLRRLAVSTGVPTIFGIFAQDRLPQLTVDFIEEVTAEGGQAWGLTHCRGILSAQSFLTTMAFDSLAEWKELRSLPHAEQMSRLRDPSVRSPLVHAAHHGDYGEAFGPEARQPDFETMTVLETPWGVNPTVAEVARQRGVDPVDAMIDLALERSFDVFFLQSLVPQDDDLLPDLMRHPRTAMGFSDSGAHLSQVFDSSIYTHLLAHWVRDREAITLEEAIAMITSRPAAMWGLTDRGRIAPGAAADLTVFDADTVGPRLPQVVHDLPGGAVRLEQRADGFAATIVNGAVLLRDGEETDARPGRLLRAQGRTGTPA